jgi:hypothetical protein
MDIVDLMYLMSYNEQILSDEHIISDESKLYYVNCADCKLMNTKYHWYIVKNYKQCGFYDNKNNNNKGHEIIQINYIKNQCYECKRTIPHNNDNYIHKGFHINICNICTHNIDLLH